MTANDLFSYAEQRRNRKLKQVEENAAYRDPTFRREALQILARFDMDGIDFTGEDFRMRCELHALTLHHPNAWGAFISSLKRSGRIVETGEWRKMKGKKSNGRRTPVYRVKNNEI